MINNGKKTIAVFISKVAAEYQSALSKGIISKGKELDYNIFFFTNFGGRGQDQYDQGETAIANLPNYQDLDGIILTTDTYDVLGLEDTIYENIKKYATCPVVCVRRANDDFYNVVIDDNTTIEGIVNHFIQVHNYKKINFLAGPKGFPDSDRRLECFLRIMKQNGLEVKESQIYYGDLWRFEGYNAVEQFLKDPNEIPEAIICANDYMAITVCNALMERGISVPDQIAVSGCDDVEDASEFSPSITTVRTPVFEMGEEAVLKVHRILNGEQEEKNSYIKTKTMIRESCGCNRNKSISSRKEMRRRQAEMIDQLKQFNTANAYMSTDFTGQTDYEEIIHKIDIYIFENKGFQKFFLCLCENWMEFNEDEKKIKFTDKMQMLIGRSHSESFNRVYFDRRDLIPKEYISDEPQVYFFTSLHHLENIFGYVAISFNDDRTYSSIFQGWLINVSNALENLRMHAEVNRLLSELEGMYIRDALTGLYNRRGLELLSKDLVEDCIKEGKTLMILCADMDDLKVINDKLGHAYGDISIKAIGNGLMENARQDDICVRCGGDEFTFLGKGYSEEEAKEFTKKFVDSINNYVKEGNYDFKVSVSYGWYIVTPDASTNLEECLNVADSRMYQEKYKKKALSFQKIR